MKGRIVDLGQNFWAPVFDEPFEVVGSFLLCAAGRRAEFCEEFFLKEAEAIASGKNKPCDTGGNGINVRITPTWVLIGNEYGEEQEVIISMTAFLKVLEYWISILKTCERIYPTPPPIDPPEFSFDDPTVHGLSMEMAENEFSKSRREWDQHHHLGLE